MAPGVDSASNRNEYQVGVFPVIRNSPGGKGGRYVWLTTYHHYSAVVTKTGSLNSPGSLRAYRAYMACWGTTLPLLK